MEIKPRPDIGRALLSADNVVVDTGSALVTASPDRFAAYGLRVVTGSATLTSYDRDILVDTTATANFTLPAATAGQIKRLHLRNTGTQAIGLIPDADTSDTIDGVGGTAAPGFYVGPLVLTVWCATDGAWQTDRGLYASIISLGSDAIALEARVDALEVTGRHVVTTSTATIAATDRVVYIDHAAARTDLTLPATPFEPFTIVKRATTGAYGVRLIPASGSDAIQGLSAGTSFDIPNATLNASTTTTRPSFLVTSSAIHVVDVS